MVKQVVDGIFEQIRHRGGRETPAARRILELMLEHEHEHFRSTDLVQRLQADEATTESTVYRTLERLVAHGILERIQLGTGPASYHLAPHHHEHLVCVRCERVVDAPGDLLDEAARRLQVEYGFVLEIGSSSLPGTCARCRDEVGEADGGGEDHHPATSPRTASAPPMAEEDADPDRRGPSGAGESLS